jgi:hypothetical protein
VAPLSGSEWSRIENLGGWLTTVVGRICLNVPRWRTTRDEMSMVVDVPDPIVSPDGALDPEAAVLLGESVGLALMVVLERLGPAERLCFVLHDMFDVPFADIAYIAGRTSASVRQLASHGDFDALVAVLDPDVVVRTDGGLQRPSQTTIIEGAPAVAAQALTYARLSPFVYPLLVNGVAGVVVSPQGTPFSLTVFTVSNGRIVAIDSLADPDRLRQLDLRFLDS